MPASATRHHAGVGGVKRAIQNRDIIRMFEGLSVSDSFLLKSNIREMLLRQPIGAYTVPARFCGTSRVRMARPSRRAAERFRHPRPLRRHDEGRHPGHLPGRDAGRHLARHRRRTTSSKARWNWRHLSTTFPPGTIFLVVVDPGVGSARRGIAAEAGDYRFVAPDNGVLTAVLREAPPRKRSSSSPSGGTRGRRSAARSKDAIGSRRRRRGWPRAPADGARPDRDRLSPPRIAVAEVAGDALAGVVRAHRPLRQPGHEPRSAVVRDVRASTARLRILAGGTRGRPAGVDLRRDRRRRNLRAVRQHRSPGARRQRGERRRRARRSAGVRSSRSVERGLARGFRL